MHASRAFLVRTTDVGESDRRVTLFTEREGTVSLLGKSARKSRKRFGGALQRYLLLDVTWSAVPDRMPILEQATLVASFWEIVEDWEKVRHADSLLEMAVNLFPQPGAKPRAFEALFFGLRALAAGEPPDAVTVRTGASMLSVAGWGPNLSGCRSCGADSSPAFRFLDSEGTLSCHACGTGRGIPMSLGSVRTWRALQATSPSLLARIRISEGILMELRTVVCGYLEYCIGRRLRSLGD